MAKYALKYDSTMVGAKFVYQPQKGHSAQWTTNVHDEGQFGDIPKGYTFITTGYYYNAPGSYVIWALTTIGVYISIDYLYDEYQKVWSYQAYAVKLSGHSDTQAQALVRRIIANNIQITKNNLVCARYAGKFTAAQKELIRELQSRVARRNNVLQNQDLCKGIQTSSINTYPEMAGYEDLSGYLDKLMNGQAVGIATWAVVVIAAVIIAGMGTAAYFVYKDFADESEKDIKYSKQLMAVLAQKLTPEEYQQLLNETKGIVTRAKIRQAAGSYGKVLMIAAGIVGGAFLYRYIKNH